MQAFKNLSERERLELSAKAAGFETKWDQPRGAKKGCVRFNAPDGNWTIWKPLVDEAQCFRLSVILDIQIEHVGKSNGPTTEVNCWPRGRGDCSASRKYSGDKFQATREAIFEAAVLLGLSMVETEQLAPPAETAKKASDKH